MLEVPKNILDDIDAELKYQYQRGWDDNKNNVGYWSAYICNYATRWALQSFQPKYNFRTCMVKVAALAVSAIVWYDLRQPPVELTNDQSQVPDVSAVPFDVLTG